MKEIIRAPQRHSALLIALMAGLLMAVGYALGELLAPQAGFSGLFFAFVIWVVLALTSYFAGDRILLATSKARQIRKQDHPVLWNVVEEMCIASGLAHIPDIYIIDADSKDGGLLLSHRDDGHSLRHDWIRPTLRNLNLIWKGPVALLTKDQMFAVTGNQYKSEEVKPVPFEQVVERMRRGERPFRPT